jgi:hypothetical protein
VTRTFALLSMLLCVPALAARPGVVNPHGDPAQCTACHAPGASATAPGKALPIVETCRSCHPDADMHPVGMPPQDVHVPEGWPLEAGLVTCSTCHAEPAHGRELATLPSPWHRGGPYEPITGLCYQCHEAAEYTRTDPHHPRAPRDASDPTCAACHTGLPETGASPAAARLRFATEDACVTCHAGSVHAGVEEHMGESMDPATAPGLVRMDDGTIACWTCHEIHDPKPIEADRRDRSDGFRALALSHDWAHLGGADVSWPGTSPPDHPPLLALSADDGALCRACHGEGP